MSSRELWRGRSLLGLGCGALALFVWVANALEATALRPHACSLGRAQLESYLLMARAAAMVLPFGGLLLAALARTERAWLRALALLTCALGVAIAVAFLGRWGPALRLPCLRG